MLQTLRLSIRNVFRNKRRTFMAMASIVVGVVALSLISGFVSTIRHALYTSIVRAEGHVQITARNYLDLGSSNPGRFYVEDWRDLAQTLRTDPELGPQIRTIAPLLQVAGVAGNAEKGASRSFVGAGYDPALFAEMQGWDGFGLNAPQVTLPLDPAKPDEVLVGVGLAQQLQICDRVKVEGCIDYALPDDTTGAVDPEIADLAGAVAGELSAEAADGRARIDLLAAAADGAPNARTVTVAGAAEQARRQADNSYVAMTIGAAQNLVYEDTDRVSHVMVQFHDNAYAPAGLARIKAVLADGPQALDVMPIETFNDTFTRIVAMFGAIQVFVGVVVCLIILFMIANTMAIVVMERVNEIGTLRALGESRRGIMGLFLGEGVFLGALSASVGVLASWVVVQIINASGLSFMTPTSTSPIPIRIMFTETPGVVLAIWLIITVVATVSSLLPARRAARFTIVDALRFA